MRASVIAVGYALAVNAFADPQIASWYTADSSKLAQIFLTDADRSSGTTRTTWSNGRNVQSQPAFSGVQEILSSSNWIYIRSTGLGSHTMGPWLNGRFPNLPTDQHYIFAIPRHPTAQSGNYPNHLGEIGMFVDGVRIFDAGDAFSYSHENGRDADPRARNGQGDHIWNRDAFVNESMTFDAAWGHQQNWGTYHYHAEPIALRYLLGDHVDLDPETKTYRERKTPPMKHSPIVGWMQDGYPIYGPYAFSNPISASSGIRRMVSGFALRDGRNGTDNLSLIGRITLPAWDVREGHLAATLNQTEFGPNVSAIYPLGHYMEDYAYLGDCGKTVGKDFDLDEFNGRRCVTPEFPNGTYAYFTTIDTNGRPVYPYNMGRRYYGAPVGQLCRRIGEPVTTNFVNRANASLAASGAPQTTTLSWNVEGYQMK
jgi:hypothetical protein